MITKTVKFCKTQIIVIEFHDLTGTYYLSFNNDHLNDMLLEDYI